MSRQESDGKAAHFASPCSGWLVWAAMALALMPVTLTDPGIVVGETVNSRLATAYALVHDGVWHIDRPISEPPNPFEIKTVDKVQTADGHLLSSKPPVLPLLMTAEYALLHRVFGWQLTDTDDLRGLLRIMILTLMKLPYAAGLIFFAMLMRLILPDNRHAALLVLLLGFATPLPGYACQINNHTPAAAGVIACLYFGVGLFTGKLAPAPWRFVAYGVASAFVFVMDLPITIFPAFLGMLLIWRFPRKSLVWAGVGALPLLLLHFSLMTIITGSPLPVQTREAMYNFRNSYWRNPIGVDGLNERWYVYLFHMTLGRFGVFLLFPALLLALMGVALVAEERCRIIMLPSLVLVAAFAIITAYYVISTNNYGGAAYGFRWYNGAVPVLLFLTIPTIARMEKWYHWLALAPLVAISVYSAWECLQAPWGASHEWTCRLLFGPVY